MMKRFILSLITGVLLTANFCYGQVEVNFSNETSNINGTVDVDVTVNGFTDILIIQFSAGWDSLVMTFDEVVSTNPTLGDLSINSISGPTGANVDEGQFSFSYNDPNGNSVLNDGDVLFTVRFNIVGEECDETAIELTGDPTTIEAVDGDFNELSVTSTAGSVMINGNDCGGTGADLLTVTAPEICIPPGGTVNVPLNVLNFIEVQVGTGTILWDPAVLEYTGIDNISISGVDGTLNESEVAEGKLRFLWSNVDVENPLTLADGESIFDIVFNVLGADGTSSVITLTDQGSLGFEWVDDFDVVIPQALQNGEVIISNTKSDPFKLIVSESTVDENASSVCVDISVENFTNILSMQYVMTWNESVITNANPMNYNLPSFNSGNFNPPSNAASSVTLSWSAGGTPLDKADGDVIYTMCFDRVGNCGDESIVDIVSLGSTNIEIVDGSTNVIDNVEIDPGKVTITCTADCSIVSIDKPCVGELGGNVIVNVPTDNCTYSWANSAGTEVSTAQNLLGIGAGTYILTVVCNGSEVCTLTAIVENLPNISVSGTVSNISCGSLGAIDVTVTGGSGNFTYSWIPDQGNVEDLSDLQAGSYTLTVNDVTTGCSSLPTAFVVMEDDIADIVINSVIVDETCQSSNGSIALSVTGGCASYDYMWSLASIGNTPNASGLLGNTYSVTVTDSKGTTQVGSFVVDSDTPLVEATTALIVPSNGASGSITVDLSGGTEPYTYNWAGPGGTFPNSNMISGLSVGSYTLVVVDGNGCSMSFGPYVVDPVGNDFDVTGVTVFGNVNGFNLSCNGDKNGKIIGVVNGGELPVTIVVSGNESKTVELTEFGTFSITDMSAGTYALLFSDASGATISFDNLIITQPDPFTLDLSEENIGCDNDQGDGFIDLMVNGGFGIITYEWADTNLSGASVDNLTAGSYTVLISDENGCEIMETIEVDPCTIVPVGCYEVRDVITPNGDGINEAFLFTCLDDFPADLLVYDRWGKLVYSQDDYDGTWTGISSDGVELIEGGYMYILTIDFGSGRREIMKGTVTILRN
ncbi:MAG: gliding motility-associated C-terminal domain-containing protein [Saprospiraceae bacterium]